MNRSRTIAILALVVGIGAASALACSDRSVDSALIVQPSASGSRRAVSVASTDEVKAEAKRAFHLRNRSDWVGRAHNAAIDEFRARLRRGQISHDMCNDLATFMSDEVRLPSEWRQQSGTRAERKRIVAQSLAAGALCDDRSAAGAGVPVRLAQSSSDVTPQTRAVLDQIQSAAAAAHSSGELAVALNTITQGSAQLPNGESAIVDATASVAQSSMEYWEANLTATQHDYDGAYSTCARSAVSAADVASTCLGLSGAGVAPTNFRGGAPMEFHFTQGVEMDCNKLDGREILGDDVKGAIGGAIFAAWGGATVLPGALLGAAGGSIGAFGWEWAQTTWCVLSGGGRARPPRPHAT